VPPGVKCTLKVRPEWKPTVAAKDAAPAPLRGTTEWSFSTGGPAIVSTQPWDGSQIEEDQHFLLTTDRPRRCGDRGRQRLVRSRRHRRAHAPVVVVTGPARDALLKARRIDAKRAARERCS
jgi:hypothetical protein